ncbi:Uncharacterized protein PRO82_000119 [Candidatus Protochlamydia amoebophila]|uniref:hypothetical protein n=1 Tax=Candidatus Protochlamydia amoebophila TaxID=362787 RepID=UPI001BC91F3D|nr:hypothetical protein [Candidatus Protochlamydia amoebophila]MBS4162842.1 Uncharacterized protein [Candidatus Protochlamydia amoebophila]
MFNRLPSDFPESLLKSGVITFAIDALIYGNAEHALAVSGTAVVATLISALTTPLFRKMFAAEQHATVTWYHSAVQIATSITLSQVLINTFSQYRVNLLSGAILAIGISLAVDGFKNRNLNHNISVIMV